MRTNSPRLFLTFVLILLLSASCAAESESTAPNVQLEIQKAVQETLSAIPTLTPIPTSTRQPTPTPPSLVGLFCEYQFCIAHPTDMTFFDVQAQKNASAPSSYNYGILAGFNSSLVIQVIWQLSPGASDPQPLLELILEDGIDTANGSPQVKLVRNMNVYFVPITTAATPVLPQGGAAAWVCGDRTFAWKAYTALPDTASTLFEEAFARFACGQH